MQSLTNKKILYIITKSNYGGAQKYIYKIASEARASGAHCAVALGGTGTANAEMGTLATLLQEKDIPVYAIKNFMRDVSLLRDIRAGKEIWNILKQEQPDVVHVTSSKAAGIGAFVCRLYGIKQIIFTSHGLAFDETWRPLYQRGAIKLFTWGTIILSTQSIMISRDTEEKTKRMPFVKDKIVRIYNGIDPIAFLDRSATSKMLPFKILTGDILIGGIGELHPNKNWSLAISAMQNLPVHTRLCIIGEGEDRTKLEKQIKTLQLEDRVFLLGHIANAATYLKVFDIFILPSKKEGLPYVLLEAGQAGCAIVCSNISGNTDIVTDGKNGLLTGHNVESVQHALQQLTENKELRMKYAAEIQITVATTFSIEQMLDQTFRLY